jgi:hypothetical protein
MVFDAYMPVDNKFIYINFSNGLVGRNKKGPDCSKQSFTVLSNWLIGWMCNKSGMFLPTAKSICIIKLC